jgi:DMSO/TMAO reductase YedYZ heme-binding membrane subunit
VKTSFKKPIVISNKWWEWVVSLALYAVVFLLMWEYHRWRDRPYSLFTANKAMAIASTLLFSFSLALGPLYRLTGRFRQAIRMRRTLGLTAAGFIVLHICISLFGVEKFDFAYYRQNWLSYVFSSIAMIGFLLLSVTSYKRAFVWLGQNKWKNLHSMGYFFLAFVVLHILALGKFPNWIQWFRTLNQPVPPGTMVPCFFMTLTISLKVFEFAVVRKESLK